MNGTPIIDPMFFYWIDVLPRFGDVVGAGGTFIGFVALAIWGIATGFGKEYKWALWIIVPSLVLSFCSNFVPSTDAMYKMAMAKVVTVENYSTAKSEGKELVEFFKAQIIDIVKEAEGEKESD